MSSRAVTRVASAVLAGVVTTLMTAVPAYASDPVGHSEGADPGTPLGLAGALLLYVGTPVAVCAVIATVVLLPGAIRSNRYRPAEGWSASPVWFAGPVDPDTAVASATTGDLTRGGAGGNW